MTRTWSETTTTNKQIAICDFRMTCIPDNGQCPGLGGYTLGCPEAVPTQTPVTNDEVNPLGTCKCEGQFFSSSDCTQAFWCGADVANNIGGLQECQEGQEEYLFSNNNCTHKSANIQTVGSIFAFGLTVKVSPKA
jgi:hypothetical protein